MSLAGSGALGGGGLAAALGLAILWDLSLGEPPALLSPRAWMTGLARGLVRRLRRAWPAELLALLLVPLPAAAGWALLAWLGPERPWWSFLATVLLLRGCFSLLEVGRRSLAVLQALQGGTPEEAQVLLAAWSGRAALPPGREGLIVATVATIARRTCDGLIAPLFWFAVLGVPGALFQRGVDSLHELLGAAPTPARPPTAPAPAGAAPTAAEREADPPAVPLPAWLLTRPVALLHELLTFVPARLAALLLLLAARALGEDAGRSLAFTARAAGARGLRSSALPMAALVGSLGAPALGLDELELEDAALEDLALGEPRLPLAAARIHQAWRVACLAAAAWTGLCALALWGAGGPGLELVRR